MDVVGLVQSYKPHNIDGAQFSGLAFHSYVKFLIGGQYFGRGPGSARLGLLSAAGAEALYIQ